MLYLIGMGLHSYKDISLRGMEVLKRAYKIYFENYTSIQQEPISELEKFLNKEIIICTRDQIETENFFFKEATHHDVCVLVAGTPMFATTHIGLLLEAKELDVKIEIVHNASILNIYGCLGLYSYHHGKTVSIPYFTDTFKPTSFYDNICKNMENKLHTLCLLDIKVDENRYMSPNEALSQILEASEMTNIKKINSDYKVFVISRFGSHDECIRYDTIQNLLQLDFGKPLHSLVIPSEMDTIEKEIVEKLFN